MILLAFVAQKLVTSSSQPAEQPTFTGFQKELTEGKVSQVTMQTKDQELEVTLKDGKTYVNVDSISPVPAVMRKAGMPEGVNKLELFNLSEPNMEMFET